MSREVDRSASRPSFVPCRSTPAKANADSQRPDGRSPRLLTGREHTVAQNTHSLAQLALKHLLPTFGGRLLSDIEPRDLEAYQRSRLHAGVSTRTVNIEIATLRQVSKANDLWEQLGSKVKMLRERRDVGIALSPEQEGALLDAAAKSDSACYAAVVLALNTTMRKTEIRKLRWEQVDLEKRILIVGKSKTDAGEGRPIPLNVSAFEALVRWAGRVPEAQPAHFVFPFCENRHVDPTRPTEGWP